MPKLKANIRLPINGLDVSKPGEFLDARATPRCKNIQIDRSTIAKRPGTAELGASLAERVLALIELKVGSDTFFLRVGLTKVELLNKSTLAWTSVANTALTGTAVNRVDWTFPLLSGAKILVFTNGKDAIRKYTGTGNDASLGGTPPLAKFLIWYAGYLLLGYVTDGGSTFYSRVQWCDTGLPETWTGGNANKADLTDDPEPMTGFGLFGEYVTVHKESCIYLGYLVSTSAVFRFDRKNTGVGAVSHSTIRSLPTGEQIFLGRDGIHLFNGQTAPLIPSPIQDELRESMNPQYLYRCWSTVLAEKDEYWVGIPIGNQTEPETVYKYNWKTGQVYKDGRTSICAVGIYENTDQRTWNDVSTSWDSQTIRWDDIGNLSLNPIIAFGDSGGITTNRDAVNNDNAVAIQAFWESKDYTSEDFGEEDIDLFMRWTGIQLWAKGSTLTAEYSIDQGNTWNSLDIFELDAEFPSDDAPIYGYFDVVSSRCRFRFTNNELGETFAIKKFKIEAVPREVMR
jgi:hypothetical protein